MVKASKARFIEVNKVSVPITTPMETYMLAGGRTMLKWVKGAWIILMVTVMKVIGRLVKKMVGESIDMQMAPFTKEILLTAKNKAMVWLLFRMGLK